MKTKEEILKDIMSKQGIRFNGYDFNISWKFALDAMEIYAGEIKKEKDLQIEKLKEIISLFEELESLPKVDAADMSATVDRYFERIGLLGKINGLKMKLK